MQLEFHQLDHRLEHLRVQSPARGRRLLASIAATGQQTPIVVIVAEEPDRYVVIDGFVRIAALRQLHGDTVEAVVWPMSEAGALVLEQSLRMGEKPTALEQGWLLSELERRFDLGLDELAERFDRSVSWVSRRLALVDLLPRPVQQQVHEGAITAHVAMKVLVPVARISLDACEQMAMALVRQRCTTRQAVQIYAAWRAGSPAVRERVLSEPALFLKAQQQGKISAADGPAAELLRDLEIVEAVVGRVSKRVSAATAEMDPGQIEQARSAVNRARRALDDLAIRMETEAQHADQSTTPDDPGARVAEREPGEHRTLARHLEDERTQSPQGSRGGGAPATSSGESRAAPEHNSGVVGLVQGKPRASP